jgi:hypothetical protein
MDFPNGGQHNAQQHQQQQNMLNEVTRLMCQAQAVQIRNLKTVNDELTEQSIKALEEGQPELAQSLWKQVVQNDQTISTRFNQYSNIITGTTTPQRSSQRNRQQQYGRNQYASGNRQQRGRGQQFSTPSPKQLNRIVREVTESVLAAA